MDRELFHLVDTQMEVLDMLSIDCGLTNRELTRLLGRRERDEGNVSGKYVKPLLDAGVVYQVSGEEYPKKELYIKKSVNNMDKIQHALADPVKGKIWQYDRIRLAQQEKTKCNEPSDVYLRAVELLAASVHLYMWCRMIHSDLRMAGREAHEEEKSAKHRPKCIFYRRYADELDHVLRMLPHMHNRRDLEKLVNEFEEIQMEKDCRAMGIVVPTAEELARAFRSPASGHIETYISPAR